MTMLGSIAHTLGANGYVKDTEGNRVSFSNTAEGVYQMKGSIMDPPGTGKSRTVFFTNPYAAVIAALATAPGSPGTKIVDTRPGE